MRHHFNRPTLSIALLLITLLLACLLGSCSKSGSPVDPGAYRTEIEGWQKQRTEGLKGDQGWLTLCGLFWLKEGENKFGTDSTAAIIFPAGKSAPVAGSLILEKGLIRLEAPASSGVKLKDSIV